MKNFFIPLLALVCADAFAQTSYVAPTTILSRKGYQIGISGDYFSSSKRVDKNGKKFSFENGEAFSRVEGEVFGQYGLTENFQIGGGVRGRQNASISFNSATDKKETDTATGLESTFVTFHYAFKPVDRLQYTLEALYRYRPFSNAEGTSTKPGNLILGDDGSEYSGGLGVTYAFQGRNFLTGRVGYRRPGDHISSEIYWQVEGALTWNHVALIAGVDGVSSMKSDPYENDQTNRPVYNTGTSSLYHGINREYMAPYAGLNVALGKSWRVELRGGQVVSGRSTDLGTEFGVSLIRRVEDGKLTKADRKFKQYDIEATITKISPKKGFVLIDKGLAEDVRKGMRIDFYEFDYVGGNILLASGIVVQTKAESAVVKITQTYNTKKELKEGIVARGSFR